MLALPSLAGHQLLCQLLVELTHPPFPISPCVWSSSCSILYSSTDTGTADRVSQTVSANCLAYFGYSKPSLTPSKKGQCINIQRTNQISKKSNSQQGEKFIFSLYIIFIPPNFEMSLFGGSTIQIQSDLRWCGATMHLVKA